MLALQIPAQKSVEQTTLFLLLKYYTDALQEVLQKIERNHDNSLSGEIEFGVIEIVIIHRVGTLPVGENIVLIAVAAAHRDEAFQACRFCIDELKRITPIWKRETTPEGESWVEEHP